MSKKNTPQRDRRSTGIFGIQGQGKSTYLGECIEEILVSRPQEPVVILINNDPPAYAEYPRISTYRELVQVFKTGGAVKFWPKDDDDKGRKKMFLFISQYLRNGTLAIEDATAYLKGNMPHRVNEFFINHKNFGIDLFTTYHNLKPPPELRQYLTHMVIFKNASNLEPPHQAEYRKKYEKDFDAIYEAWKRVEAAPRQPGFIQYYEVVTTSRYAVSR